MARCRHASSHYLSQCRGRSKLPYVVIIPQWVQHKTFILVTWWRHQMETFSALLAICAGNSPVPGDNNASAKVENIMLTWGTNPKLLSYCLLSMAWRFIPTSLVCNNDIDTHCLDLDDNIKLSVWSLMVWLGIKVGHIAVLVVNCGISNTIVLEIP